MRKILIKIFVSTLVLFSVVSCVSTTPGSYWVPGSNTFSASFGVRILFGAEDKYPFPWVFLGIRQNFGDNLALGVNYDGWPIGGYYLRPFISGKVGITENVDLIPYVGIPFYFGGDSPEGGWNYIFRCTTSIGANVLVQDSSGTFGSLGIKFDPSMHFKLNDDNWKTDLRDTSSYAVNVSIGKEYTRTLLVGEGQYDLLGAGEFSLQSIGISN